MTLGVHFALSPRDYDQVLSIDDPDELVEFISEDLEERYFKDQEWICQTDKAWDAIHRCLTDGRLLYESGPFPLAYAVLGGGTLDAGDGYTACLVEVAEVQETAKALAEVTKPWMRQRYDTLVDTDYGPISDDDFEYTWSYFEDVRDFFQRAAQAKRPILFTTDA